MSRFSDIPCFYEAVDHIARQIHSRVQRYSDGKNECFNASFALGIHLAAHGIPAKLIKGTFRDLQHWWLHVGNKRVDITAFGDNLWDQNLIRIELIDEQSDYWAISTHNIDFERIALASGLKVHDISELENRHWETPLFCGQEEQGASK